MRLTSITSIAAAVLLSGCSSGVVLHFATDGTQPVGAYCVGIGSRPGAGIGTRTFGQRYEAADHPLPQTLGLNGDGAAAVSVRLTGLGSRGPLSGLPVSTQALTAPLTAQGAPLTLTSCVPVTSTRTLTRRNSFASVAQQAAIMHTGSEGDGSSLVLLGDGQGLRHVVSESLPAVDENLDVSGSGMAPLVALDADGDCADDLVVAANGGTTLWRSDRTGLLVADPQPLTGGRVARAVAAGDLDEDGRADLFVVGDDGAAVLLHDAAGGFTTSQAAIDTPPTGASVVALGDLDGDGHLDALVGAKNAPLRWYQGDGIGHFTLVPGAFTTPFNATGVVLRNLDGDRGIDVLVSTMDGTPGLRAFANDGQGKFTDASVVSVPAQIGSGLVGVVAGDLDGDCADDFVVLSATGSPLLVTVNDFGQMQVVGPIGTTPASSATIGDLDGDGVMELVLVHDRRVSIWSRVAGGGL